MAASGLAARKRGPRGVFLASLFSGKFGVVVFVVCLVALAALLVSLYA
jgi:hypothetical protein